MYKEKRQRLPCRAGEFKDEDIDEDKEAYEDDNDDDDEEEHEEEKGVYTVEGKEVAEITLPGRRRKLVTATGYSPTSDSGESNLGTSFVMQNTKCKMQNSKYKI